MRDRVDNDAAEVGGGVGRGVGQLGADARRVAQAARLPRHVAARVHEQEAQLWVSVEHTGHDQPLGRDRRLELVTDRVLEVVALEAGVGVVVRGVDHERQVMPLSRFAERFEVRVGQRRPGHRGADLHAHGASGGRLSEQLGRNLGCLQRYVREPAHARRFVRAELRQAGVDGPAQRGAPVLVGLIGEQGGGDRHHGGFQPARSSCSSFARASVKTGVISARTRSASKKSPRRRSGSRPPGAAARSPRAARRGCARPSARSGRSGTIGSSTYEPGWMVTVPPKTSGGRSSGSSWRNGPDPRSSFRNVVSRSPPAFGYS